MEKRNALWGEIQTGLQDAIKNSNADSLKIDIKQIGEVLNAYNNHFQELTQLVYLRGFRDYGLEGKMRDYAHQLERYNSKIKLSEILSLRRHEKDFFLRKDSVYIHLFDSKINALLANINTNQDSTKLLLKNYRSSFHELVQIHKQIGLSGNDGLRHELNTLTTLLDDLFLQLSTSAEKRFTNVSNRIIFLFSILLVIIILVTILWSNFITS